MVDDLLDKLEMRNEKWVMRNDHLSIQFIIFKLCHR